MHGATRAPYVALDLIAGAKDWTIEEGYRAEEDAMGELLASPQAQASAYAFTVVERRTKKGAGLPDVKPRRVQKVGIVGAGLMATQLATLFVRRLEVPVVLRDLEQSRVDEALETIREEVGKRKPFLATLVSGGTGWEQFEGCDLVLEAVFEELSVKQRGLRGGAEGRARRDPRHEHLVAVGRGDGRSTSGCTSSTRSRSCRSSRSCARRRRPTSSSSPRSTSSRS